MINVSNIEVFYGEIKALHKVSFNINEGEVVSLLGANGAGKTTILRAISGLKKIKSGNIEFEGTNISNMHSEQIVKKRIAHVPEGRHVFPGLSVAENLEMGTASWNNGKAKFDDDLSKVYQLFPRLKERSKQLAWSMSGGEQQMLAIGRALMARPKVMLLDEPSLGLSPVLVEQVYEALASINKLGVTILLVEQNAYMAMKISTRCYVIENGHIVLSGTAEELENNSKVKSAYLGG